SPSVRLRIMAIDSGTIAAATKTTASRVEIDRRMGSRSRRNGSSEGGRAPEAASRRKIGRFIAPRQRRTPARGPDRGADPAGRPGEGESDLSGPRQSGKLSGLLRTEHPEEPGDRIEELVHHALLQRDDRIIGDGDVLRADLGAALGDVAEADAVFIADLGNTILGIERVHLEGGEVDEVAGAGELGVLAVLAQHVADILAEEALDALAELLHAVDV